MIKLNWRGKEYSFDEHSERGTHLDGPVSPTVWPPKPDGLIPAVSFDRWSADWRPKGFPRWFAGEGNSPQEALDALEASICESESKATAEEALTRLGELGIFRSETIACSKPDMYRFDGKADCYAVVPFERWSRYLSPSELRLVTDHWRKVGSLVDPPKQVGTP